VTLRFPSGRTADEIVPRTPASLAWMANLAVSSCTRIQCVPKTSIILTSCASNLDPVPGIKWPQLRAGRAQLRVPCSRRLTCRLPQDLGIGRDASVVRI